MLLFSLPSFLHLDLTSLILAAAVAAGSWIGTRIIKPKDHERAQLLSAIGSAAAALVVAAAPPTASWPTLLEQVVRQISTAAGLPTRNAQAIERAAAAALTQLGKNPGVK